MSDRVDLIITKAVDLANQYSHEYVTLEHLLYAIMEESDVSDMLTKMKVDVSFLAEELEKYLRKRDDIVLKKNFKGHKLKKGDIIVFASVGAGMNVNAITYQI